MGGREWGLCVLGWLAKGGVLCDPADTPASLTSLPRWGCSLSVTCNLTKALGSQAAHLLVCVEGAGDEGHPQGGA